jgi:rhamnosyltransferase subunit B
MHVVLFPVGSAGDVHPFLAIGQALVARGHQVEMLASPVFQSRVEAAGIEFVPLGSVADYESAVAQADLWHARRGFAVIWAELLPRLMPAYDALRMRLQPGRSVMAGGSLAYPMRLLQETHGVPAATVHLSPACILSGSAPPRLPGLFDLGRWPASWVRAFYGWTERHRLDPLLAPGLDKVRGRLGLPPVRQIFSHWGHSPDRVICAWPSWFAPPQADWPPRSVTVGFPRWPAPPGSAWDAELETFLGAAGAPVGFTPGSAMAHGRVFFERALDACGALGLRAVLVSPYRDQWPQPLPPWAMAIPYAPFERLVPRLRALVHHGGIGTSAQCLAAGVPQGVLPFAHDQFDNAQRLVRSGVARSWAPTAPRRVWRHELRSLVIDGACGLAARELALRVGGDAGAPERIAGLIEALDPAHQPGGGCF